MFGLSNLMSMFAQDREEGPEIDRHHGRRRRLANMVTRTASTQKPTMEPGIDPTRREQAARFIAMANRRLGLTDLGLDHRSVALLDAHLDATAMSRPGTLDRCGELIASWLGEIARRSHGLVWDGDQVTDGRVALDPRAAVEARLGPDRVRLVDSLEHALAVSAIRSAA